MTEVKHHTTANFTTLGLLIGVIIFGFLALQIVFEEADYNKVYEFDVLDIAQPYVLTETITTVENGIETKYVQEYNKTMVIDVVFTTTTFSAQNPIEVAVDVHFPDLPKDAWKSSTFVDVNFLAFPGSYTVDENTSKATEFVGLIKLDKMKPTLYRGYGTIMYPFSGDYGSVMLDPSNAKLKSYTVHDGIATISLESSDLKDEVLDDSAYTIESSGNTISLAMNNITHIISFIILLFALIQLRPQIIDGVVWVLFELPKLFPTNKPTS